MARHVQANGSEPIRRKEHGHMAGIRAARTLVCAVACLLATVAPIGATVKPPRTPAAIELRRAAVIERLAAIELEQATIAAEVMLAGSECARRDLETRRARLVDESAVLQKEMARLMAVRTRSATGPLQPVDPQGLNPLDLTGQSGQVSSGQAFNPAISVIPDVAYYYDDRDGDAFDIAGGAEGFTGHEPDALERGFNLREMEIAFSGAVDPYFDVWATLAVGTESIEAEEVYVQTRKFIPGLQLRVGRFLSGVGYANQQHTHQWDFVDRALPYEAILGGNLGDTGLQVTWLPNLPMYTLLGFEALQGDNERLSHQLAGEYPDVFEDVPGPRLFTGFLKAAPNTGYLHAVQGGVSYGFSRSHQAIVDLGDVDEGVVGTSWFVGTDWVWRYDSGQPFGRGDLSMQVEYLYRKQDLDQVTANRVAADAARRQFAQDGLYGQLAYGLASRWTVAGRVDVIGLTNRVDAPDGAVDLHSSRRYSLSITFNPTEFSRLRVQYNAGRVWRAQPVSFNQVFVQFQMSLGAHGAHRF
jgi:hypothetical protein